MIFAICLASVFKIQRPIAMKNPSSPKSCRTFIIIQPIIIIRKIVEHPFCASGKLESRAKRTIDIIINIKIRNVIQSKSIKIL